MAKCVAEIKARRFGSCASLRTKHEFISHLRIQLMYDINSLSFLNCIKYLNVGYIELYC